MISIPLPFVVALLLGLLFLRMALHGGALRDEAEGSGKATGWYPGRWSPLVFVGACALSLTLVGLRWSVDSPLLNTLRPVMASTLPPIAWLCFAPLARVEDPPSPFSLFRWRDLGHGFPVLAILILALARPVRLVFFDPVDFLLAMEYLGYGGILLWLGWRGPDQLAAARLSDAPAARRAILIGASALIFNAFVDLAIGIDFELTGGRHAPQMVAAANILGGLPLALTVALFGRLPAPPPVEGTPAPRSIPQTEPDDHALEQRVRDFLEEHGAHRDPDLTLNRLARDLGVPARRLSEAINRVRGTNVSRYINGFRVADAQRMLRETDTPVTTIQFDCGFQTKSNFNREFARVTGVSPSAYRAAAAPSG